MAKNTDKPNRSVTAKTVPSTKPKPIPSESAKQYNDKARQSWNIGGLFWGLLLIVVGAILLLDNLGIVEANWNNLWRLWPLAIVATGISLLATRHLFWKLLSVIFIFLSLIAVVLLGTGQYTIDTGREGIQQQTAALQGKATRGEIVLTAGASKVNIGAHEQDSLANVSLTSEGLELQKESEMNGSAQKASFSARNLRSFWLMPQKNTWDVTVTKTLPLAVTVDAGASSIDADLSKTKLESLKIDSGASSLYLTLGNIMSRQSIVIDSGASNVTIRVPKDSGVKFTLDGGLTKKNLADLKETDKDTYMSEGYRDTKNQIDITADLGASSVTIVRY